MTKTADKFAYRRVRVGKTARERASGEKANRYANRRSRDAYVQWCKSSESAKPRAEEAWSKFPWGACNGKKTRAMRSKTAK